MRSRSYIFSLVVTVLILLLAYLFSAVYLTSQLTGLHLQFADWSVELIENLFSTHPQLLLALAVPAVYCLLMLYAQLYTGKRLESLAASHLLRNGDLHDCPESKQHASADQRQIDLSEQHPHQQQSCHQADSDGDFPTAALDSDHRVLEQLQQQLQATCQQLNQAKTANKQFLSGISHELRTPINGILGLTELLSGSGLDRSQSRYADSIRRSGESLLGVINNLLDYSRMESGTLYLEKASFNLRDLVEDVCDLQAREAQLKDLELICHIDRSMNDQVLGDANRIRQFLSNLICNAIKFTESGEVVVRVRQTDFDGTLSSYQLDVVDTGVGISPEGQAQIFESFQQADFSAVRENRNTGLGLPIAHKLIEMMDGSITLRSRMQEGAQFRVTIKLKKLASESDSLDLVDTLRGARVLVVDDNETNRTILFHQLRSWGLDPETVDCGGEALRVLQQASKSSAAFEAAILDLHMPQMDGLELAAKIQSRPEFADLKRMMLTSAALELEEAELEQLGIEQYISKPARQWQLYTALTSLIPAVVGKGSNTAASRQVLSYRPLHFKVLLAEDNLINQEVALNMLENFGCEVELAVNGQTALEACEQSKFDVIMMDCLMPVLDGMEATRLLRESGGLNARTPVLALTANVSAEGEERCLASGMDDYICKPVKQNELYRRLQQWSERVSPGHAKLHTLHTAAAQDPDADEHVNIDAVAVDASGTNSVELINQAAIDNIRILQRAGTTDLVDKVVGAYLQKSPMLIEEILAGSSEKDFQRIREAAHSMKSSSAYVGADEFAERCRKIEQAAASGTDDIFALVADIAELYDLIAAQLQQYLEKAA